MRRRVYIYRQVQARPVGLLGCLVFLLALVGLAALAVFVFLPLLGIAAVVVLALMGLAALTAAALRVRAWWQRLRGLEEPSGPTTYNAEAVDEEDDEDDEDGPRKRLSVQVRRRPHRE